MAYAGRRILDPPGDEQDYVAAQESVTFPVIEGKSGANVLSITIATFLQPGSPFATRLEVERRVVFEDAVPIPVVGRDHPAASRTRV